MKIKPIGDNPSKEKEERADGKVIVKDYVLYDPKQDWYFDSTKCWASHYIQYTYESNGELINKEIKRNKEEQKTSKVLSKFLK